MPKKDKFTRNWIVENSIEIIEQSDPGVLTIRALHYRLVARGMTNTQRHYKRVVNAMIAARWDNDVDFDAFSDHEREMIGETRFIETDVDSEVASSKRAINHWVKTYSKNKWENQPNFVEVFIEKKALQGVFEPICDELDVAFGACKGYPSLTFLSDASERFKDAESAGKNPIILYFGDYDPSGEDIPRSMEENFSRFGVDIEIKRVLLMENQVVEMGLPPAPKKDGDSRSAKWDGLGQVELDAVEPSIIQQYCRDAIKTVFDDLLFAELVETERDEQTKYRDEMREFIENFEF